MKVIMVSEQKLDDLIELLKKNLFSGPDHSKMEEKVDMQAVNYHLCGFVKRLKEDPL